MNIAEKKKYVAPEMEVIDMECRTILCDSGHGEESDADEDPEGLDIIVVPN